MEVPAHLLKEKNRILKKYNVATVAEASRELKPFLEQSFLEKKTQNG
jgi:hypothetical protein